MESTNIKNKYRETPPQPPGTGFSPEMDFLLGFLEKRQLKDRPGCAILLNKKGNS
jgi:hypothetical protein